MACNQTPDEIQIRDCTSFVQFQKEYREFVVHFRSKGVDRNQIGKDGVSKILRPLFVQMMTIWKKFVHDLLKETVEAVFVHATTNSQSLLQTLLERALLSCSSYSVSESCSGSDSEQKLKLEIGATVLSKHLLSDPSILKNYEQELLGKCDQVTPIFSGDGGIDCAFNNIFQIPKPLSVVILESGLVKYNHLYHTPTTSSHLEYKITTTEALRDRIGLYHGACCVFSDQHPEVFDKLDGELFNSPDKTNFHRVFTKIPGDYLYALYKCVRDFKKDAYVNPADLINFHCFIDALASGLLEAVSKVILDEFGIQVWHKRKTTNKPFLTKSTGGHVPATKTTAGLGKQLVSEKDKIPGVRKVWGTVETISSATVASTIKKLTTVGEKISVKRRYKTSAIDSKMIWWHMIHGDESTLGELEGEWDHIQLQTNWKLLPCYSSPETDVTIEKQDT